MNKEIESKINITDAEISNYYGAHKSEFNLIEPQYHLAASSSPIEPSKQVTTCRTTRPPTMPRPRRRFSRCAAASMPAKNSHRCRELSEDPSSVPTAVTRLRS
jgi:hypothetical protein